MMLPTMVFLHHRWRQALWHSLQWRFVTVGYRLPAIKQLKKTVNQIVNQSFINSVLPKATIRKRCGGTLMEKNFRAVAKCNHFFTGKLCFSSKFVNNFKPLSFHKRPLPSNLIALSSSEGKQYFREALTSGGMECFFPLAEQFVTQSDPSYCSLSSLAMVLNALNYDPKKVWKGAWRWVSEEMLHCETQAVCGHSLEKVQKNGLNFSEFESLARCHGVNIFSKRVCHSIQESCGKDGFKEFERLVDKISATDQANSFVVCNFSRKALGQTGDGHYSPIGGFHREQKLVLILDVARFKYPPYWVKLEDLWESMALVDQVTGLTRGYFVISTWEESRNKIRDNCPPLIRTWESIHTNSSRRDCGSQRRNNASSLPTYQPHEKQ